MWCLRVLVFFVYISWKYNGVMRESRHSKISCRWQATRCWKTPVFIFKEAKMRCTEDIVYKHCLSFHSKFAVNISSLRCVIAGNVCCQCRYAKSLVLDCESNLFVLKRCFSRFRCWWNEDPKADTRACLERVYLILFTTILTTYM